MANETILVVDGDTRSRKVLEVGFSKSGYRVVMTETMREALIELERGRPDLVVSDTDLPDGDGFELCKRVKEDPDLGFVPFLFLTDESSLPNKIKGLEIGADDYLTRPIYLREVTTRAKVLLQKRTRKLLSESDVEEFEGELSDITMIDLLQTVEAEDRTGTIHLKREGRDAVVTFRAGNILDAVCGKLQGKEAVYRLMLWPSGSFVVRYHDDVRETDHIEPDTQDLIVEGIDRLQAWDALVDRLPSLERVYEADYRTLPDLLDEAPDAVGRIARLFDGVRSLRDVVDDSPLDDITTLQVVERLLDEDVLRDVTPEDEVPKMDSTAEATSHLAEWLEAHGGERAGDLQLEADQSPEVESSTPEASEASRDVQPSEMLESVEDDPAATMEDLEKAEQVRRKVEAQQLRQQQVGDEEQPETARGDTGKRGVPQIPGATEESERQPPSEQEPPKEAGGDAERDREDTPRAHPASSQDESVEAWLSEGPEVEEYEESRSETRPQFPAVDIGDEIVEAQEKEVEPLPETSGTDSSSERPSVDESTVDSAAERREEAISRAEHVSEEASPSSRGAHGEQSSDADEQAPPEGVPADIEETPTEAIKSDIRPEDLTGELEPAGGADEPEPTSSSPEGGPLDVERISNNGEVVQAEYDLSTRRADSPETAGGTEPERAGLDAGSKATDESLAEETPVERKEASAVRQEPEDAGFTAPGQQTDEPAEQTDDTTEGTEEATEEASSTHEMWVDREVPDEQGLEWGDEPSARPGEREEPAEQEASDVLEDADFEAPPPEADAPAKAGEAGDSDERPAEAGLAESSEREGAEEPEAEPEEEFESESSAKSEVDEASDDETSDEGVEVAEESARETVDQEDRETVPSDEMPDVQEPAGGESDGEESGITEESKEADFFEQGDDLRDTREDDFEWDFEEEASGGSDWQYWAVGAAVLALGVLGVMAATGSGLFGGSQGDQPTKAESVSPKGEAQAAASDDAAAGAVAKADTGTEDAGDEKKERAGLDEVGAEVVVKQLATETVDTAKSVAEEVEPQEVAQQGGKQGDQGAAAGGTAGQGGSGASVSRVRSLMNAGKLDQAYDVLRKAREASPGSSTVAQLHVQLGSKFQTSGREAQAREIYEAYLDQWPNGRFAGQLKSIIENQL